MNNIIIIRIKWSDYNIIVLFTCYVFVLVPFLPSFIFDVSIPSLLNYNLSLCFLVAIVITFFSVFGTRTILCRIINILLRLCVVPSVSVTDFPTASFTTCTSSLHLLSVPFLKSDVSSILTLSSEVSATRPTLEPESPRTPKQRTGPFWALAAQQWT